jgi:F-type H+-transporting ATPase subunit alpha
MQTIDIKEQGTVLEAKRSIVRIAGLPHCLNGQLVDFSGGLKGMIMGFKEEEALALILSAKQDVRPGEKVYGREELFKIPVGYGFLGRIVNALAEPCDGKGRIVNSGEWRVDSEKLKLTTNHSPLPTDYYPVFRQAPSVLEREPIRDALETGIRTIDSMIPIGKGQRELIVSDRMIGKSTIAIDTILNQSRKSIPDPQGKRVICIYCLVGKDYKTLTEVIKILKINVAFEYTILVFALASSSPGEQYLAPYTTCALGEFFMDRGEDVFVAFDDLTKHAWAYRELSLLLERSPGRDAYPGDIFYLHSQLMERAGKLNEERGSGSMTFFPIVETIQGDITGYIPSNLISITDGQIYLSTTLFAEGFKPAIDVGLSVSRIGNKVQSPALKELSGKLRLEYIQYKELLKMSKLKAGLSPEVEAKLKRGQGLTQILIQEKNRPSSHEEELIMLYALRKGLLDRLDEEGIERFKKEIYKFACEHNERFIKELAEKRELTEGIKEGLDKVLEEWCKQ